MVQLREKALNTGELFDLAATAMEVLRALPEGLLRPRLLVNSRADVALRVGADGVHLPSGPGALTVQQVRAFFAGRNRSDCLVSVSCHTLAEVEQARDGGADWILFGPVFEKRVAGAVVVPGRGLPALQQACRVAAPVRVLALGGVTAAEGKLCVEAGAAGFASIRAFG